MSTYNTDNDVSYTTKPKKDNKNIFIALLGLGLLGAMGYIWYSKKQESDTDKKQEAALVQTTNEKADVEGLYQASLTSLDSLTNLNTSLNGEMLSKDGVIGKLKMDIENDLRQIEALKKEGKSTSIEETKLRQKINALNVEISRYKDRVAELEEQNAVLTNENTTVKREKDSVTGELGTTRTVLDQTTTQKKELEDKVDVGQTLSAINFYISGINEVRGKEKETSTAKKVDKLRIGFELDANRIATSGKKEIFVSITGPDGKPITVEALGSGMFNTRDEGQKPFTNKIDVDYTQGQRKAVSFDWKQNSDFQRGDYKVEVYQNGYKIGQGTVTLKKGGLFG
jgi:hypothetical protein